MSDGVRALVNLAKQWQPIFALTPELERLGSVGALVAVRERQVTALEARIAEHEADLARTHDAADALKRETVALQVEMQNFRRQQTQAAEAILKQAQDDGVRTKAQAEAEAHDIKARANAQAQRTLADCERQKGALVEEIATANSELEMVENRLALAQRKLDDVRRAAAAIA